MQYGDLIQFEPIETVVQLQHADAPDHAQRLVETFVISDRMAEQLVDLVFPQLQYSQPADNKGLLIVGNYGTGKSHLMALISAIAERQDLADSVTSPQVAEKSRAIAGRFEVVRAEIGATEMSLRDILCGVLEDGLDRLGVSYRFPPADQRHENKQALQEMMAAFHVQHPDKGLLLVLDELLDYMRSRRDQELSLDLSFLREVGEACRDTRLRFIAGVQEGLFDNPRFQFVAESLRRVRDRFVQARIAREDVAYVVSERLLKKNAKQTDLIREHLTQFASLYGTMNERLDEFVRLFPIHPAYLDTFERVYVAEKREVLKTLSEAMRGLVSQPVPPDEPGLVAYDSYWSSIKDNVALRSVPEIREVIDRSDVLEARIEHAFTRPQYRPTALRIIHALSVHRLTTADIYAPLGATAEELRDDLCLFLPMPERDAEFLRTMVETTLTEVVRTVSGQFLSCNQENGQYYLDLKKDVDFDSLIEKKADVLDDGQLDRYYFDALRRVVLEDPDAPAYATGYRIWEHEIEWRERRAGRSGYLFFGAPNERSTAQPPRDFYLYFLQPFDPPKFADEKRADEVFFGLERRDETFDRSLRMYAGAREQAATASGSNRSVYEDKAATHLRDLTKWLREHMTEACDVTYQGATRSLAELLQAASARAADLSTVRDIVNASGAISLAPHFEDQSPEYPAFTVPITRESRSQAAHDALRWLSGGVKSRLGTATLEALDLLDGESLATKTSSYAQQVVQLLSAKPHGHVLNRSELVASEHGVDYWNPFRLEPDFLIVVLAALVHSGDLTMSIPGAKIDAAAIEALPRYSYEDLLAFKHVERPRDLPLAAVQELCDLLGVPRGLVVDPSKRDVAVQQIQQSAAEKVESVVLAQSQLTQLILWGDHILSDDEQGSWNQQLATAKTFLESLQVYNTSGKLRNFRHTRDEITEHASSLTVASNVRELHTFIQRLTPIAGYMGRADAVLPADHPWVETARAAREDARSRTTDPAIRENTSTQRTVVQALEAAKLAYRDAYLAAHTHARLGASADGKKGVKRRGFLRS